MSKSRETKDDKPPGKPAVEKPKRRRSTEIPAKSATSKSKQQSVTQANHLIKTTKPADTQGPLTETEMEVHHHPQLEHKHKPWKEYLLEGFMIFIAVMMGFIAENIRENITNNDHAEQLTLQLAHDLRADIKLLDESYVGETRIAKSNDTLLSLLKQPLKTASTQRILWFVARSHSLWPFHPATGTIAAIKSEIHLKQFSNSKIIGLIANYEGHTELLHLVQDIALQYQRSYLDPFLRQHFMAADIEMVFKPLRVSKAPTRNLKQDDLDQLAADLVLIRINTNEQLEDNRRTKSDAQALLQYIIKQYNLEKK